MSSPPVQPELYIVRGVKCTMIEFVLCDEGLAR